jgi:Aspartyl protease
MKTLTTFMLLVAAVLGYSMDASAQTRSVRVPVDLTGSTVLVPGRVNDSGALWFILDTGANSCVLDHKVADQLRLKPASDIQGTGAGRGPVPMRSYPQKDVTFRIASKSVQCDHVLSVDLSNQPSIIGRRVDGILGSDFISQFVVEVDYERRLVRLHDPERFHYRGKGEILPLTFERRIPYVTAEITVSGQPPTPRKLLIDLGSQDAVDDDLLLKSNGNLRKVTGGVGLGQTYEVSLGQLALFQLGRFSFKHVPSVAPGVALIGGEILRRFHVYFDYKRERMILEPNRHLNDPFPAQ